MKETLTIKIPGENYLIQKDSVQAINLEENGMITITTNEGNVLLDATIDRPIAGSNVVANLLAGLWAVGDTEITIN